MKEFQKMGYRLMYKDSGLEVWGKPVAFHLFTIKKIKKTFTFINFFIGVEEGKPIVYSSVDLDKKNLLYSLKKAEMTNINHFRNSSFEFLELSESLDL